MLLILGKRMMSHLARMPGDTASALCLEVLDAETWVRVAVRAVVPGPDPALTSAVLDVGLADLIVLVHPVGARRFLMRIILALPDLAISGWDQQRACP